MRAHSLGLTTTTDDDFESFFRLHHQIHLRKRAPLYLPNESFRTYVQRLLAQDLARLYHACLPDGRSVATQLILTGSHPITHTVCAASDEAHLNTGANSFLRWMTFNSLAALGYTGTDLTGAPYPHKVSRFKRQLGGAW
ncbi:MAG: GNAT family N-acetyltransferase [Caldilineaceae bacterium]|nr:GNAT family N-acetyltransferase [Caldilineaceae bacterium]